MDREAIKSLRMIDMAGAAVCVALTGVVFVGGVQPMLERQAELSEAEVELQAKRAEAQQSELTLTSVRRQVSLAEQTVAARPLRLQPLERLNTWLALIAETAASSGVQLDQLEPRKAIHAQHYETVPIRVVGRGNYQAATRFLHDLHEAMPDTAVPALKLEGNPQDDGGEVPAKFEFDLLWHAAPVKSAAVTASAEGGAK